MLTLPGNVRLFFCQYPINMRKSFEGFSAVVEQLFPGELLSGAFFIFLNRRKDHMKVLFWDNDGLVIWFSSWNLKALKILKPPKNRRRQLPHILAENLTGTARIKLLFLQICQSRQQSLMSPEKEKICQETGQPLVQIGVEVSHKRD